MPGPNHGVTGEVPGRDSRPFPRARENGMHRYRATAATVAVFALATALSFADISINLKATHFTTAPDEAVSSTGPAFWLVWSADASLGPILADGSVGDGDVVIYQDSFSYNPAPNYYGFAGNPIDGRVFVDGESSVPDFNAGYLFGVAFLARPAEITEGTFYSVSGPADLAAFTDFTPPPAEPPATADSFDFADTGALAIGFAGQTVQAAALIIVSLNRAENTLVLTWDHAGSIGGAYALQFTTNLLMPGWTNVPPFTNMPMEPAYTTITNPAVVPQGFYRMVRE